MSQAHLFIHLCSLFNITKYYKNDHLSMNKLYFQHPNVNGATMSISILINSVDKLNNLNFFHVRNDIISI